MVLIGKLAFLEMAAMMGRRSAAEEGGSLLDLLYFDRFSDGDLDLALRRLGGVSLVLGGGQGELINTMTTPQATQPVATPIFIMFK